MKKLILSVFTLAVLLSSCGVDVDPKGYYVTDEQLSEMIKKDPDLVLGPMMSGAIMYMHNGNRRTSTNDRGFKVWNIWLDVMGNDMVVLSVTNWFGSEYQMSNYRTSNSTGPADFWYNYYKMIFSCNQILDLIPEDASGKALDYRAQCLTLRSLSYYYLINIFQDDYRHGGSSKAGVPVYITEEGARERSSTEAVYTQIIGDLREAVQIFSQRSYNALSDKEDIDQTVANVILARALLTKGEYQEAANAADAVISQYSLMGEDDYLDNGFQDLKKSEVIWGYEYASTSNLQNRSFASFMSPIAEGAYAASSSISIDSRLYDQIPESDYRKKNFASEPFTHTYADETFREFPKYTSLKFAVPVFTQDEVYMRVSEMYLVKAEALARAGNNSGAQDALYELVSNRDAAYVKSSNTGDALLEEILLQSRIELWGEGFEFFLNKRFNKGVDRSGSENHLPSTVFSAGKDFTFQIPQSELESNPFINAEDQNPL